MHILVKKSSFAKLRIPRRALLILLISEPIRFNAFSFVTDKRRNSQYPEHVRAAIQTFIEWLTAMPNRAKQSGKEKDWSRFKALKKQQNKECRRAHNNYVASTVAPELESKPRKFWSYIKSKKCESFGVSSLRADDGITYTDNKSKANILNKQFKSVSTMKRTQ